MTYDYNGVWSKVTALHSALFCDPRASKSLDGVGTFNIHSAVKAWIDARVDPKKLIIGAAAYGREVSGVTPTDKGSYLYAEFSGQGSTPLYYNPNMRPSIFNQLDHNLTKGNDGSDYNYGFAYAYDTDTKNFVSFDSNASVTLKSCYVAYMKLGGIMFWDLGADTGNQLVNTSMSIRDDVEGRCFGNFSFDRIKELIHNSEECSDYYIE
jgi:chitinase